MKRKIRTAAMGAGLLLMFPAARTFTETKEPNVRKTRSFDFTYEVTLKDLPSDSASVKLWMPVATSEPGQTVTLANVSGPVKPIEGHDPEYGNRILYANLSPASSTAHFSVTYRVIRRPYSGQPENAAGASDGSVPIARFLRPDRLVPIDGKMKELADEITRGKRAPQEIARSIYDYVFKSLRYDKSGTGWGRGDAVWACDAKRGNCTDFHSLFIALMRAEKIPARFEIGFPLPENARDGEIPGYHCWAEFHVDGQGWVPVDISEAWKAPAKRDFFFGNLDANRIQFTTGRDITLAPPQAGEPLNYFIYPYAEVDGKPYTAVDRKFSFHEIPSSEEMSGQP